MKKVINEDQAIKNFLDSYSSDLCAKEKEKEAYIAALIDHADFLPDDKLLTLAKKGLKVELSILDHDELRKEFVSLWNALKALKDNETSEEGENEE